MGWHAFNMEIDAQDDLYRMKAVDRALQIPSVNYLWDKSAEVYDRVKGSNQLVNWAFGTVELVVNAVIEKSLPVARFIKKPIYTLDTTLCYGLDFVEVNLPIIKEDPVHIINHTKSLFSERFRPAVQTLNVIKNETTQRVRIITLRTYYRAHYLIKIYSWQKMDKVMSTTVGIKILKTVDNTTSLAEHALDKYFPPIFNDDYHEAGNIHIVCCEHATLHHTMIKMSDFSSRASRRIYISLMDKFQHMYKIEIFILILHAFIIINVMRNCKSLLVSLYGLVFDSIVIRSGQ